MRRHVFHILDAYIYTELMTAETPHDDIFMLATLYDQINKVPITCLELSLALRGQKKAIVDRLIQTMAPEWDEKDVIEAFDSFLKDKKWTGLFGSYLVYLTKKKQNDLLHHARAL